MRRLGRVAGAAAAPHGEALVGVHACLAARLATPAGPAMLSACVPAPGADGGAVAVDEAGAVVKQLVWRALRAADATDHGHRLRDGLVRRPA
jgi:hypothetical protein